MPLQVPRGHPAAGSGRCSFRSASWCCWRSHGVRCGSTPPGGRRGDCRVACQRAAGWAPAGLRIAVDRGLSVPIEVRCGGAGFESPGHAHPAAQAAARPGRGPGLRSEADQRVHRSARSCRTRACTRGHCQLDSRPSQRRGLPSEFERASLVLDGATVRDPGSAGDGFLFKAQRLGNCMAAKGRDPPPTIRSSTPCCASTPPWRRNSIRWRPSRSMPKSDRAAWGERSQAQALAGAVQEWQAHNGQIEIIKARVSQDDVIAVGAGALKLTARGGFDGNLQVTVVGIEKLLKMFDIERFMPEGQVGATLSALDFLIPGLGGSRGRTRLPAWSRRSGKKRCWKASRRLNFQSASSTARFSSDRSRWA